MWPCRNEKHFESSEGRNNEQKRNPKGFLFLFLADAERDIGHIVFAVFGWFVGGIGAGFQIGVQFFFGKGEFFAAADVTYMENRGKAFAVFVVFAVKSGTVYGLFHKITLST